MKRKLHGKYTNGGGWIIDIKLIECVLSKNEMNSFRINFTTNINVLAFDLFRILNGYSRVVHTLTEYRLSTFTAAQFFSRMS